MLSYRVSFRKSWLSDLHEKKKKGDGSKYLFEDIPEVVKPHSPSQCTASTNNEQALRHIGMIAFLPKDLKGRNQDH